MRFLLWRLMVATLGGTLLAGAAAAQSSRNHRDLVDEILTRAVLERGAFLACARLDQSRETAQTLVRGWEVDLADAGTALRALGYTDADIRGLIERYNIEKAAPKFADLAALADYCMVLGDWRERWTRLRISIPKVELRRVLRP
jgi:hypothetical protein